VINVPLPVGLGGFAIPIANVAPFNVVGTVQFRDGDTNIGAPVPVTGGIAIGPFTILPPGSHSLTEIFTPKKPAAWFENDDPAAVGSSFSRPTAAPRRGMGS